MGCFRGAVLGLWSESWRGCDAAGAGAMTRSKPNGPLSSVDARCTRALRGGRRRRRLVSSPAVGGLVFVEASFPTLFGPVGGAANPGMSCSAGSRRCLWQSAPSGSSLQPWSATPSTARFSGSAYRGPDPAMALRRVLVVAAVSRRRPRTRRHRATGQVFPGRRWGARLGQPGLAPADRLLADLLLARCFRDGSLAGRRSQHDPGHVIRGPDLGGQIDVRPRLTRSGDHAGQTPATVP